MKATVVIIRIDELGRIVVPKEIRNQLGISDGDPIEIYVEGEKIILKKQQIACAFCGSTNTLSEFKGHKICQSCLDEIKYQG